MSRNLTTGIVRILALDGSTAGTGFVVADDGLIATCAHVVEAAGVGPGDMVCVVFQATGEDREACVESEWWRGPDSEDVVVLRLEGRVPERVASLQLGSSRGCRGHEFEAFGYPRVGPYEESHARGTILGPLQHPGGWQMLEFSSEQIALGMSGAPVFDTVTRRVIGMVNAFPVWKDGEQMVAGVPFRRHTETNFAIPTEVLRLVCPVLQVSDLCPYQGLAAFTEADAEFFFGRKALVADLVDHLRGNPRFLAVVGPSGSGKSSVVQAGLFPALHRGEVPGSERWHPLSFRPGADPFAAMTTAGLDVPQKGDLSAAIRAFLEAHPQIERLVLFADQFEELFTLCPQSVQEQFLRQLAALLEGNLAVTVVLTLRADFYGHLFRYRPLVDWLKIGQVNVPPMGPEGLRAAVEKPAVSLGLRFEPGLVETIVEEAGAADHPLPLLESALTQLWEKREDGTLTHGAYQAVGQVAGAIGQWAEDAYTELALEERPLAQRVFTRLVRYGEGEAADTRQRQSLSELVTRSEEQEPLHRLVQRLADARLLITGGDPGAETVEIIHDALLQQWGRLKHWTAEQREFYLWRQRLDERLEEWEDKGQDEGALLRGALLAEAERWLAERSEGLNPGEQRYIWKSVDLQEREQAAGERLRRRIILGLAGGLLVAMVLAVTAGLGWQSSATSERSLATEAALHATARADAETAAAAEAQAWQDAEAAAIAEAKARQIALSRQLAAQAVNQLANNYEIALLLAIEAGRKAGTAEAFATIRRVFAHPGRTLLILSVYGDRVNQAVWNRDESRILTASNDGTVRVWNAETGKELITFSGHAGSGNIASWNAEGNRILTASNDGTVRVWNAETGKELITFSGHTGSGNIASWNAEGNRILTASNDGTVRVWNAETGKELITFSGHTGSGNIASWNAEGNRILTASNDGTVRVWNAETGKELITFSGHTGQIHQATWNSDESRILTASNDGTVRVWNAETGEELVTLSGHELGVNQAVWNSDGSRILTAGCDYFGGRHCSGSTVRVWDAETGAALLTFNHGDDVWQVTLNPDESRILTAGCDDYLGSVMIFECINKTVQVWDMKTGKRQFTFSGHMGVWNTDGSHILTISDDDTARVWDVETGTELITLSGHTSHIDQAMWNRDESRILARSFDGTVRVWDASTVLGAGMETKGDLAPLLGHTDRVYQVIWSVDRNRALTIGYDQTVRFWDAEAGREIFTLSGHTGQIHQATWNSDESRILTASNDGTVRVWNAETGKELITFSGHTGKIYQAMWNRDESRILTVGDHTVQVWDIPSGNELMTLTDDKTWLHQATWNKDEKRILGRSSYGTVRVWDATTGDELITFSGHVGSGNIASWNAEGNRILTADDSHTVRVWNAETGKELITLSGHTGQIHQATWNSDESRILTASNDGTVRVWNAATGKELITLSGHTGKIYQAMWNRDESRILTASNDGTVRVWNAETGKELITFSGHTGQIYQAMWNRDESRILTAGCVFVARAWGGECEGTVQVWNVETGEELLAYPGNQAWWSPDGNRILIAGGDGSITQWYVWMEALLEEACRRAQRNMTVEEWQRFMKGEEYRKTCPEVPGPEGWEEVP